MKNLYQYSAKENLAKFIFMGGQTFREDRPNERDDVQDGKAKMEELVLAEIQDDLTELKGSVLDRYAVYDAVRTGGDREVYKQRDGTFILEDPDNDEKIIFKQGEELKIKDGKRNRSLKIDLKNDIVKENVGFELEQKEDIEQEKIEYKTESLRILAQYITIREDGYSLDLHRVKGSDTPKLYEALRAVADDEKLSIDERKDVLQKIVDRFQKYTGDEDNKELSDLVAEAQKHLNTLNGVEKPEEKKPEATSKQETVVAATTSVPEKKETEAEKQARLEQDKKVLEDKEAERKANEERKAAHENLDNARKLLDSIDFTTLDITTYQEFQGKLNEIHTPVLIAEEEGKKFPELKEDALKLKSDFDEARNKVGIYERGAGEQERVEKKYQKKTEEQLQAMDTKIEDEVKLFQAKLEELEKKPENLPESPLSLEPADPKTLEQIQQGMMSHRTESMKTLEEINFLQECSQELGEKIAKFEEKKSAFTLGNVGRFVGSSIAILPGMAVDLTMKVGGWFGLNPQNKRSIDVAEKMFGVKSPAAELRKEKEAFEISFAEKQQVLAGKKSELDSYGKTLSTNSESLRASAPNDVRTSVRNGLIEDLPKGADPNVEPWKGMIDKITGEVEGTTIAQVASAVDQLDMNVDGSVSELTEATGGSLGSLNDSLEYIKTLDITSATALDMSVGFLTKNVAKVLDVSGDFLAKIPVLGLVGGVLRGAGGMIDGIGSMITDPWSVVEGLGALVGIPNGLKAAGEAWKGLGMGLFAGEAWSDMAKAFKEGDLMTAWGEMSAAVGEVGLNVAATFFTGGAAAGARGGAVAGRIGKMTSAISKVATNIPGARFAARAAKWTSKTRGVRYIGKAGDVILTPMRWGLKPLKGLGKFGTKIDDIAATGLRPTRWSKMGRMRALDRMNKQLTGKVSKLDDILANGADDLGKFERRSTRVARVKAKRLLRKNKQVMKKLDPDGALIRNVEAEVAAQQLKVEASTRTSKAIKSIKQGNVKDLRILDEADDVAKATNTPKKVPRRAPNPQFSKKAFEEAVRTKKGITIKAGKYKGTWTEGSEGGWMRKVEGGRTVPYNNPAIGTTNLTNALHRAWKSEGMGTSAVKRPARIIPEERASNASATPRVEPVASMSPTKTVLEPLTRPELLRAGGEGSLLFAALKNTERYNERKTESVERNINDNFPEQGEHNTTSFVDLNKNRPSVEEQVREQEKAPTEERETTVLINYPRKEKFEGPRKENLESFFREGVGDKALKEIKADIKKYSASDVEVTINGEKKELKDIWTHRNESGEQPVVAIKKFESELRDGADAPCITKIDIKFTE